MKHYGSVTSTGMKKNRKEPILTPAMVDDLKRKGWSQVEIAREFGVTESHVSWVKHKTSHFTKTPREQAMESYPWKLGAHFHRASPGKRLRDHAEFMVTEGRGMAEDKLKRLARFWDHLESEDVVLEFDPEIPPSPDNKPGGFAYRKRVSSDGDLIIRVNEHTTLTEFGKKLWRLPRVRPNV